MFDVELGIYVCVCVCDGSILGMLSMYIFYA